MNFKFLFKIPKAAKQFTHIFPKYNPTPNFILQDMYIFIIIILIGNILNSINLTQLIIVYIYKI
jgi:hypothetical protein